jgi:hypothetical protein
MLIPDRKRSPETLAGGLHVRAVGLPMLKPYWENEEHGLRIYHGDCLDVLPALAEAGEEFDLCLTDPPYGCEKRGAEWDTHFPVTWYTLAQECCKTIAVMTGSCGVREAIALDSDGFLDVIAGWNKNNLTRGRLGFGNWLACTVFGERPRQGQNFTHFAVAGEMLDHPTPKPIEFVEWLVWRLCERLCTILDPFLGSGTTLVAAYRLGRQATGIEISEEYCSLAAERLERELAQGRLFEPQEIAEPEQEALALGGE